MLVFIHVPQKKNFINSHMSFQTTHLSREPPINVKVTKFSQIMDVVF